MRIRAKDPATWQNATPILEVVHQLKEDVTKMRSSTREKIKDIFVCSLCDAYQLLESQHMITRRVIEILRDNELPFTILTKNNLVLRDMDIFQNYERCRVGLTIVTLDDGLRKRIEPNASPIVDRIDVLKKLKTSRISTYCSIEPLIPDPQHNPIDLVNTLKDFVDLFEFGILNSKERTQVPLRYDLDYYKNLFPKLITYCKQNNVKYCIASHSVPYLESWGIDFIHPLLVTDRPYREP
jgi:hypothetical protein